MFFRYLFKACMIAFVCMGVASYVVYLKTGRFWVPDLSISNLNKPKLFGSKTPVMEPVLAPTENTYKKPTYKWWANGHWNYGQTPPEGVKAIRLDKKAKD